MSVTMTFGGALRLYREALGLSLQGVADRAHLSKAHVWDLENGKSGNPTLEAVAALADALEVDPEILVRAWLSGRRALQGETK